jgi:hypothetical protein
MFPSERNLSWDTRPAFRFACHGPDNEDRQAGLRLDLRDTAIAELDSGATAVMPGDPAKSELVTRITSTDPDVVMPPPRLNKPITPQEAEVLKRWIAEGAEYRGHWAFERVERPAVPKVKDASWPKTPIDRFILARLEQEGLAPNSEADRATLARRLALDLTGLPTVPSDADAFLADTSPDAYERYVDTLLASPHYGERMDLPFDRFTVDQLAGDLLDNPASDQIVATGFNRNHRLNGEGGIITEEWRVETVIDRVETTGQTWLGLTAGCARCHDHKYDPLSQKEFYAFFALFNNVPETGTNLKRLDRADGNVEPVYLLTSPEQERELARLEKVAADAEAAVRAEEAKIEPLVAEWEKSIWPTIAAPHQAWEPFEPLERHSNGGASFRRSTDGTWLVEGTFSPQDSYEFKSLVPTDSLGGIRLEVFPDPSLAGDGGFGRAGNGNIVVLNIEVVIEPPDGGKAIPVELVRAEASYEQQGWPAAGVLHAKGELAKGWAIDGHDPGKRVPRRLAAFPGKAVPLPANSRLVVRIRQEAGNGTTIGRLRLAVARADPGLLDVAGWTVPAKVKKALAAAADNRPSQQKAKIQKFYRENVSGPIRVAETAYDEATKSVTSFKGALPSTMVMREGPPRKAFVLIRGEYDKRGEEVVPAGVGQP